jgi:hypothetical protein
MRRVTLSCMHLLPIPTSIAENQHSVLMFFFSLADSDGRYCVFDFLGNPGNELFVSRKYLLGARVGNTMMKFCFPSISHEVKWKTYHVFQVFQALAPFALFTISDLLPPLVV